MEAEKWQMVAEVSDELEAEILRGLLVAQGLEVLLSQEAAAHYIYPTNVGGFGEVQLLVPSSQVEAAQEILEAYRQGDFERDAVELSDSEAQEEDLPDTDQG